MFAVAAGRRRHLVVWFCSTKVAGDQLRRDVTGLLPGSLYFFRVAGVNRMGQGPWSEMTDMVRPEPRLLRTPTKRPDGSRQTPSGEHFFELASPARVEIP